MTDDVKAAVELMRENARSKCQCLDCDAQRAVLPWFDGEDARTAAAVAAAREEVRESMAREYEAGRQIPCYCESLDTDARCSTCECRDAAFACRASKLVATPLADRIAELEAAGRVSESLLRVTTAERDEANDERDALRAQQDDADACIEALRADVERLRAQVKAARALCREVCDLRDSDYVNAYEVLAAMDGAKP